MLSEAAERSKRRNEMKKFVLLLIALTIAPWARTWEDAEAFYCHAWFEDDSLDTDLGTDRLLTEDTLGIYFYAGYDSNDDSMGVLREYYFSWCREGFKRCR